MGRGTKNKEKKKKEIRRKRSRGLVVKAVDKRRKRRE
jgi:hypothetical protein